MVHHRILVQGPEGMDVPSLDSLEFWTGGGPVSLVHRRERWWDGDREHVGCCLHATPGHAVD